VTITKSISIEATEGMAGILAAGTNGIVVNAGATDVVVLRGLTFNGYGTGLKGLQVISAGKVIVEDCFFSQFTPRGISIEPSSSDVQVYISRTRIQSNTSNGVVVVPTIPYKAQVMLDNVSITNNTNFGLSVTAGAAVVVRNSAINSNAVGTEYSNIRADASGGATTVDLDNVTVNGAPTGILALGGATVRVNNTTITGNTTGLTAVGGAQILSFGNNRLVGNGVDGAFSGTLALQ